MTKVTTKYKQSRVAKLPVSIPNGIDVKLEGNKLSFKAKAGAMELDVHPGVTVAQDGDALTFAPKEGEELKFKPMAGTMRALAQNIITGLTDGFEKKLQLVGVGYRAQAQGKKLNLSLGFSHPVEFNAPEGITFDVPSQTEITVKGFDKQLVGACAAKIRAFRPPEPYKGKGVRYVDEHVSLKEAKKK